MTTHFLFFILDVILWLVAGALLSGMVERFEQFKKRKAQKIHILFVGSSLLAGCFAVLHHSLPEFGLSYYSIALVTVVDILFAFFVSPNLRLAIHNSRLASEINKATEPIFHSMKMNITHNDERG
jgi:hypothetical protein